MTIGHAAFTVSDMDASIKFYSEALGIEKAFSLPDKDGNPWIEYLKVCDGQFVELFYNGGGEPVGSFNHLCLHVDDIHKASERVEAAGYKLDVKPAQGSDGNWQSWTKDPDGVRIELMQIMQGSLQSK